MSSSNKDWKPYFFFARRRNSKGEAVPWDVRTRWREILVRPEAGPLSREEKGALDLLKENLREQPLWYTALQQSVSKRAIGSKRSRPDPREWPVARPRREERDPPPLSPTPLSVLPPSSESPPPPKKKRSDGRAEEKRALLTATKESLRTFEAEEGVREAAREAEEEEFQRALRASVAAAEGRLLKGPSLAIIDMTAEESEKEPEAEGDGALESESLTEGSTSISGSGESSSSRGSRAHDLALVTAEVKSEAPQ